MELYILFLYKNEHLLFTLAYSLTRDVRQAGELLADGVAVYWAELNEAKQLNLSKKLANGEIAEEKNRDKLLIAEIYRTFVLLMQYHRSYEREEDSPVHHIQKQMVSDRSLILEESLSALKPEHRSLFLLSSLFGWEEDEIAANTGFLVETVSEKQNKVLDVLSSKLNAKLKSDSLGISGVFLKRHFEQEQAIVYCITSDFIRPYIDKGVTPAGLKKGQKLKGRKKKRIWMYSLAVAAAAGMLLLFLAGSNDPLANVPDGQLSIVQADSDYFKEAAAQNEALLKLLNSVDLDQPELLGYSLRKNDIRLTIDGMMTMGSETVLWYTLENEEGDETPKIIEGTLESAKDTEETRWMGVIEDHQVLLTDSSSKVQGQIVFSRKDLDFNLTSHLSQPQASELTLNVYMLRTVEQRSDQISFQFELPAGEDDNSMMTIELNQRIEIEDYAITLTEVNLTKYVTEVKWEPDPANPKIIEELLNPSLIVKKGNTVQNWSSVKTSEDGRTIYFPTVAYEVSSSFTFQIDGVFTELGNTEFVVDTDKGEFIDTPDVFKGTYEVVKNAEAGTTTLRYTALDQQDWLFLKNQYADESGNSYDVLEKKREGNTFSYTIPDDKYTQPIHFMMMDNSSNQITQTAEVPIYE